jgi:hypothetical protein
MTHLMSIIILAAGLLFVVGLQLRDAFGQRRPNRDDYTGMEAGQFRAPVNIPPAMLMDRIFAEDDLTFVSAKGVRPIRREFLRDRRRIAMSWLNLTRREAIRILRQHLATVRTNLSLQPLVELQLLAHTLLFFAIYALLWTIVATYGAFWARGFVRNAISLAGKLSALGSRILADADRSGLRLTQSHGHA